MSKSKRTRREIVQAIYDALPVRTFSTVDEISKKADVDWKTCQAYLNDLEFELGLQGAKHSWLDTVILGSNKGYRRKRR
jgi:predicted transcriptional regulator